VAGELSERFVDHNDPKPSPRPRGFLRSAVLVAPIDPFAYSPRGGTYACNPNDLNNVRAGIRAAAT
jgi:hypothetical protein